MHRWTYTCLEINSFGMVASGPMSGRYLEQAAVDLGNDCWELVLSFAVSSGNVKVFFKRPA